MCKNASRNGQYHLISIEKITISSTTDSCHVISFYNLPVTEFLKCDFTKVSDIGCLSLFILGLKADRLSTDGSIRFRLTLLLQQGHGRSHDHRLFARKR